MLNCQAKHLNQLDVTLPLGDECASTNFCHCMLYALFLEWYMSHI